MVSMTACVRSSGNRGLRWPVGSWVDPSTTGTLVVPPGSTRSRTVAGAAGSAGKAGKAGNRIVV